MAWTSWIRSVLPFFYPSIEPKLGFERREAAPPGYEQDFCESAQWHNELTSQPRAGLYPLCFSSRPSSEDHYAATCGSSTSLISQNNLRTQRLATAAAATEAGFPCS